jgi:hypothetical protein
MKKSLAVLMGLLAILPGCGSHKAARHFTVLLDTSASIEPSSQANAIHATGALSNQMRRGDAITVIPITSDAQTEAQGRILRFTVPVTREAYDQDLRRFNLQFHEQLQRLQADAKMHPGTGTDILGSLDVARQEILAASPGEENIIAVFTDGIQEDGSLNFKTDPALADETGARNLAAGLVKKYSFTLSGDKVFLGGLKSTELGQLPTTRRAAISVFWIEYFKLAGAPTRYATDGPGLLPVFVGNLGAHSAR